jgi:hypothetical protein
MTVKVAARPAIQLILGALGAAALARGGYLLVSLITPRQWPEIGAWLIGGVLIHDLLIAPVSVLLGRILRPGAALRAGWLAAGTVLLVGFPLVKGAQRRANPTVNPGSPVLHIAIALGLVLAGVLVSLAVRSVLSRRRNTT